MKIPRFITVVILMCMAVNTFSQSESDLIILDEIVDDLEQLEAKFSSYPFVYVTDKVVPNALEQISGALANIQIEDLHIYVLTKPGAMIFNSIALIPDRLIDFPYDLNPWSKYISGKVVIHSDVVFVGEEGLLLKQRLESITGLEFTMQN